MKWIKDRFPLLIIFLIMCCAYAFSVWHYQTGQNYQGSNYSTPVSQSVIPPIHKRIKGIPSNKNEREQEQKEKAFFETADHKAQIRMADYAFIGIFLGITGTILLFGTLIYTRNAAQAANDTLVQAKLATQVTEEIGVNQLRAYVGIVNIRTEPKMIPQGIARPIPLKRPSDKPISFIISIKNFGQTPANSVHVVYSWDIQDANLADEVPLNGSNNVKLGNMGSIPPQGERFITFEIRNSSDIEWHGEQSRILNNQDLLNVFGKIEYIDINKNARETFFNTYLTGGPIDGVGLSTSSKRNQMT